MSKSTHIAVCLNLTNVQTTFHWRIQEGTREEPPLGPISLIFMQFSEKSYQIIVIRPNLKSCLPSPLPFGKFGSATTCVKFSNR